MGTCHCLCAAVHAELGICDVDAPRALVTMELAGSAMEDFTDATDRTILMCQPCAEAAIAAHPRARQMVVVGED